MDAAEGLLTEQGYAGTSMDQVAQAAQTSKSSIFWHFESKEELLLGVVERAMRRWETKTTQALLASPDARARLEVLITAYEGLASAQAGGLRLLLTLALEATAGGAAEHRVQRMSLAYRRSIEMVFSEGEEAGLFSPLFPTAALASLTLAAFEGLFLQHRLDPEAADFSALRGLLDLALGAPAKPILETHLMNRRANSSVGLVQESQREEKRQRILDAAVEVFAERGYFGARISDLADAAGIADGTVYLYFKSKDELLITLFEEQMGVIFDHLMAQLDRLPKPSDRLRAFIHYHLKLAVDRPTLMQVLTIEVRQSARFIKNYKPLGFRRYLNVLSTILTEGQSTGEFRDDTDPRVFRRALFGAVDELAREWLLSHGESKAEGEPLDPIHSADRLSEFLLRGLAPA